MGVSVEFYGGPVDGRLAEVQDPMPRVLHLPVAPSLIEILAAHDRNAPIISPSPLTYEWDGTVREDGVRRFRLR